MEILNLVIIFFLGIFGNFFAAISGGAALIYIPVLIFFGFSPSVAVATNRFSALGSTPVGLYRFIKGGKILYKLALPLGISAALGSFVGANLLLKVDEDLLQKLVAVFIILIALLLLLKKDIGLEKKTTLVSTKANLLGYFLSFLIGIYAGFFGAAFATFFSFLLITIFGLTFLEAAGTRKLAGLFIGVVSSVVFVLNGRVDFLYAGALLIGRSIGAYFGIGFALKHGEKYARVIFIIFALVAGIKLLI